MFNYETVTLNVCQMFGDACMSTFSSTIFPSCLSVYILTLSLTLQSIPKPTFLLQIASQIDSMAPPPVRVAGGLEVPSHQLGHFFLTTGRRVSF